MSLALSLDLRRRVVAAVDEDGLTHRQAAERFKVSAASANMARSKRFHQPVTVVGVQEKGSRGADTCRPLAFQCARAVSAAVARNDPTEPRRVFRRLPLLSRMEHHEQDDEQVFP